MLTRRRSLQVNVGGVTLGGDAPVRVQSMTNTDTHDVAATVEQVRRLEEAGCEIVRLAVPDEGAVRALKDIRKEVNVPIVADVHFDHRLALGALEAGADKLRINPGNIGSRDKVEAVARAARERGVPIRVGVNSGSIRRDFLKKYGPTAEAMVESALEEVKVLEEVGFQDIVISLKASDVPRTVEAYELIADRVPYPLHIGITEAGTVRSGSVRSAVGLGILLWEGIGDTVRVSLSGDPVEEVRVAYEILRSLGLRRRGVTVIACPTCGRTEIDVASLAERVERTLEGLERPLTVAVMGCVVNGPGEAKEADVGVAGGRKGGVVFRKGKVVRRVEEGEIFDALMEEIGKIGEGKAVPWGQVRPL
ncbi:MAG TPA: flavodoxin-dependent (E)-4-hydroxy-3-methylbut-2-enyl-diphosphate synthase [Candidatus Latescibacteria bacterium]|nr:flavodoxin-dependent (E)-4-hydroxy-3-methylbut-2-enyl-diphosphate synthase [Candidatus Latescibacterota bacterium]